MHDHIEEMGKNIVHRSHPDEPNKHSRLWIKEEIEEILANNMVKISLLVRWSAGETNTFQFVMTSDMRFLDNVFGLQGTEATRFLKLNKSRGNARIVMKGPGKMKKL
ncbi:NB-ARC domains-containing protein [Artemisia annua]|uniref:NB-ARC domains-containing protein n=1 Tax=Artemisia annua TaxID=35608 RepID=A0A2U1MJB4_ARTAN|nr:NB-ARC domains-containing protein [Artemisia annua]